MDKNVFFKNVQNTKFIMSFKITSVSSLIPLFSSILTNSLLHNVGTYLQTTRNQIIVIMYIYSLQNVEAQ
jgi:hypothetical protein